MQKLLKFVEACQVVDRSLLPHFYAQHRLLIIDFSMVIRERDLDIFCLDIYLETFSPSGQFSLHVGHLPFSPPPSANVQYKVMYC